MEKRPKDMEDAQVGKLCGTAPPHPVRCPDIIIDLSLTMDLNLLPHVNNEQQWLCVNALNY